jgi:hypothetical protein
MNRWWALLVTLLSGPDSQMRVSLELLGMSVRARFGR